MEKIVRGLDRTLWSTTCGRSSTNPYSGIRDYLDRHTDLLWQGILITSALLSVIVAG
jgi:hypothetical protein